MTLVFVKVPLLGAPPHAHNPAPPLVCLPHSPEHRVRGAKRDSFFQGDRAEIIRRGLAGAAFDRGSLPTARSDSTSSGGATVGSAAGPPKPERKNRRRGGSGMALVHGRITGRDSPVSLRVLFC